MSMIDERLETLLVVAREKNFTRAGDILGLTQPAVSGHMKRLEEELKVNLFLRKKGELALSEEGEVVVEYAKRLKALCEKMQLRIRDTKLNIRNIRVGITHTQESGLMAEVLSRVAIEKPELSITIITDNIKNLYDKLENFEIDVAIIEGRPVGQDFNYMMIDTDYLVCVAAPTHPFAKKTVVTLGELKAQHLIMRLPTSATMKLFRSTLESVGENIDDLDVEVDVDNIATIKDLIRKEIGVSVLARGACGKEIRSKKLIALPIENLSMVRETNIVYHKTFNHTEILDWIAKLYGDLAKSAT